jgi:hypothetical protein
MGKHVPPGMPKRDAKGGQPSSPGSAPKPCIPTRRARLCCPMNSYMLALHGPAIVPTIVAMPEGYHRGRLDG